MSSTELAVAADRQMKTPIPLHNGVMSPDKWTLFGRMSVALSNTDFIPKGMRGNPPAIMGCMVYGDALGLHPAIALKEIHVIDGKVGLSGALMLAKIREAGHKVKFVTMRDADGGFIGVTAQGERIAMMKEGRKLVPTTVEEDEWSFTIADAHTAGLLPQESAKAAWNRYPQAMCRWRAVSGLARFLFADVFAGGAVYVPEEAEEAADEAARVRNGAVVERDDPETADYGDDPDLAGWLVALFAAANSIEQGRWMPKKIKLALKGKTQDEREEVARQVAEWIAEQGLDAPPRPNSEAEAETVEDAVVVEPDEDIPFGHEDDDGPLV